MLSRGMIGLMAGALIAGFVGAVPAGEVHIQAAASLQEVLQAVNAAYFRQYPAENIRLQSGASGVMARQIEQGAPTDIFISANDRWIAYLCDRGLVDAGSVTVFAYNRLVLAGHGPAKISEFKDLAGLKKIALGDPATVPAGEYAMQAIDQAGLDQQLAGKIIPTKDVREALRLAEMDIVEGALVYNTDARASRMVQVWLVVPAQWHAPIVYTLGMTAEGLRNQSALKYCRFLLSHPTQQILRQHGFEISITAPPDPKRSAF